MKKHKKLISVIAGLFIHIYQRRMAWMLFLLVIACSLPIGEYQSVLHFTLHGEHLDLAWLSGFIMTSMTTFVTVSEFFEKWRTEHMKKYAKLKETKAQENINDYTREEEEQL